MRAAFLLVLLLAGCAGGGGTSGAYIGGGVGPSLREDGRAR